MEQTVAQLILNALAAWGVKNIYGVSGDAILPFMDALGKQEKIKFYSTANEQGAAFMACGEARVTGMPGVCLATEGPGALNLVNGVADACRDDVPMLVITGQVETSKLSTNTKQYIDQQTLFTPITGFTVLLTRPESAVGTIKIALEKAIGDNTPCHVTIPRDIFLSPAHRALIPDLDQGLPPGVSGNIDQAINLIRSYRKPVIITGKAAIPFKDTVFQLARQIGAGIIPAQGARGIYPGTENIILGGLGEAHIPPVLKHADSVLLIGASPYEHKFIPSQSKILQIDTRPQQIAHQLRPVSLTGDVHQILRSLMEGLSNVSPDAGWLEEIKKCHADYVAMIRGEADLAGRPIPIQKAISILNDTIPADAIIAIDSGEFMHWFDRGFIARGQQVIISDHWRCMGGGLLLGLGAQTASPDKKVVILTGDGGFIMTMQELITAVRYSLPVVVIIFNNSMYSLEKHRMEKAGIGAFGVDVKTPDFASFAVSCGVEGIRVEDPETLRDVFHKAVGFDRPVVIDVISGSNKPGFI
ncbi:thiamine pyrophosphate-binding protein [Desulfocucumis palustris]|uniref:thiamine pyrophosphate-binding protein n=1 Tax=Desulfocucumis palustris TaxID=1898651 RepID=UPI0013FE0C9B|nr:thiamine pyrophosphate-binding protein [Desulfocucumis palustris]